MVPFLQRLGMVRWWANCQHGPKAHKDQVLKWFEKNPHFHKQPKAGQSQFLQNKSQVIASLTGVQTKGDFVNHLEDILLQLKSQEPKSGASSVASAGSDADQVLDQDNEDDCFGIEGAPPL